MNQETIVENIPEIFADMPDHTRLWIYQASHELSDSDCEKFQSELDEFCKNWSSHGKPLKCAATILFNTFIIIGVDEISQAASGCSIDSSVNFIKEMEEEYDVSFFEHMIFGILQDGEVKLYDMETFKEKFKEGTISPDTAIFNNQVKTKSEYERAWIIPLKKSWHMNIIQPDD